VILTHICNLISTRHHSRCYDTEKKIYGTLSKIDTTCGAVEVLFDGVFETSRSSPDNLVGVGLSYDLESDSISYDLESDSISYDLESDSISYDLESDSISCSSSVSGNSVITQPDAEVVTPSPSAAKPSAPYYDEDDYSDKKPAAKPSAPNVIHILDSDDDDDDYWDKKPAAKPSSASARARAKRVLVSSAESSCASSSARARAKRVLVSSAESSCASSLGANNPAYETAKTTLLKMRDHGQDEVEEALHAVGAPWGVQAACNHIQKMKKKRRTDPGQVKLGMKVRKVCAERIRLDLFVLHVHINICSSSPFLSGCPVVVQLFSGAYYNGVVSRDAEWMDDKRVWSWKVIYEDGDEEDMEFHELHEYSEDRPTRALPPCLGRKLNCLELFSGKSFCRYW
jgi:hypothetical protein